MVFEYILPFVFSLHAATLSSYSVPFSRYPAIYMFSLILPLWFSLFYYASFYITKIFSLHGSNDFHDARYNKQTRLHMQDRQTNKQPEKSELNSATCNKTGTPNLYLVVQLPMALPRTSFALYKQKYHQEPATFPRTRNYPQALAHDQETSADCYPQVPTTRFNSWE